MQDPLQAEGTHLVLYDGVCGLCNRMTRFVMARDRGGLFVFASLQSLTGRAWLERFGARDGGRDTFYVVVRYRGASAALLSKSEAALFLLRSLGGPWRWAALLGLLPRPLLNAAYGLVARSRYRIFGRYQVCPAPGPCERGRFVDV
jgi:predicted DCC family thiol-disulfide oxidoreductase YuxK